MKKPSKSVLITGVSTGIGRAAAEAFLAEDYKVFGAARKPSDAEELAKNHGDKFHPLTADVTDPKSLETAVRTVEDALKGEGLGGLVNNAGIALPAPLAEQPFEEVRRMFEVNVFGALAVTRTFLPLLGLREGHPSAPGRIVNVSSVAGKQAFPFFGAYAASKHALEGLSTALRRELMPWGIDVIVVAPGNVKTPIWGKVPHVEKAYAGSPHGEDFKNLLRFAMTNKEKGMEPREIAKVLVEAMESPSPKTRYAPVAQKFANWTLPRLLPDRWLDKMVFKTLGMEDRAEKR